MVKRMSIIDYTVDDQVIKIPIQIFNSLDDIKFLIHPIRWEILKTLGEQEMFPKELAEFLYNRDTAKNGTKKQIKPISEGYYQKIYYHIRLLKERGLIIVKREEKKRGARAVYYVPVADIFGINLTNSEMDFSMKKEQYDVSTKPFLGEFLKEFKAKDGNFDGYIVTGSPDDHGAFQARARDSHYGIQLGLLIGRHFSFDQFLIKIDTDLIAEQKQDNNLIIIGGPITNITTEGINDNLPAKFVFEGIHSYIESQVTMKRYTGDAIGLIAKIPNPLNPKKRIIVVAGKREIGTKSAIMALTLNPRENLKGLLKNNYVIIRGLLSKKSNQIFKSKGEAGKLDEVEILETVYDKRFGNKF